MSLIRLWTPRKSRGAFAWYTPGNDPELQRILQRAPRTGTVEITVFMKEHRPIGTVHKIIDQEQGKAPEETGA